MVRLAALALLIACWTLGIGNAALAASPPPGTWAQLPGTALSNVFWRNPSGKHLGDLVGAGRPENIVRAWSGAAYDRATDRLIIAAAGGHGDYAGYEVYLFTLADLGSGKWTREIDPVPSAITPYQSTPTNSYALPNGSRVPASRHTYNGLVYLPPPHGKVLLIGGARWWDGNGARDAWLYDVASKTWAPSAAPAATDASDLGINTAWDSDQRRVLYQTYARLRAFDPGAATGTHTAVDDGQQRSDSANRFMTALYDAGRKRYVMAGPGGIEYYDVGGAPPYKRKRLALTGAAWPGPYAPGFDCGDPACSRYAMWGGRSTIYFVNGESGAVTAEVGAGPAPPGPEPNGTFGRFRYSPRLGGFVLVAGPTENVWVYRPKAAEARAPAGPPATPSADPPATAPTPRVAAPAGPPVTPPTGPPAATPTPSATPASPPATAPAPRVAAPAAPPATPSAGPPAAVPTPRATPSAPTPASSPAPAPSAAPPGPSAAATANPPATPSAAGPITIPPRTFVAIEGPEDGKGIPVKFGMKHVTGAFHPPSGRIYFIGGDYRSRAHTDGSQSYNQEVWSLSLAERWAGGSNSAAGWRLEVPYCNAPGGLQPKHPDFVGWVWDAKRAEYWLVPGTFVHLEKEACPQETPGPGDDPAYKRGHLMRFNPSTRAWTDLGTNVGVDSADTWMSVLDPVKDRIIRLGLSGRDGGVYNVYDIATSTWSRGALGSNAAGRDIRLSKEYLAPDFAARVIYAIDGVSGRLHGMSLDTLKVADLGPVPGGPLLVGGKPTENYAYPVWDSTNRKLLWLRGAVHVYDPATKAWESIPSVTTPPGLRLEARSVVYDPTNNVTLFLGGLEPANPHLFLFRYAPGAATAAPVPAQPSGSGPAPDKAREK